MSNLSIDMLYSDPNGQYILRKSSQTALTWEDYLELPLPSTMGAKATRNFVQAVRRPFGIAVPFNEEMLNGAWYGLTHELRELVELATRECHASYELWRTVGRSSDQHFLVNMRVTDALASLELDGLDISADEAKALLRHEKSPRGPAERLLRNTFRAIEKLPSLAAEPISRDTVELLYQMAADGVDLDDLATRPRNIGLSPLDLTSSPSERDDAYLDSVIAYAADEAGDPHDAPILRCLFIEDIMYTHQPLGKISGQVGRLLSDLYAIKHDLPVLAYLPMSKARLDWVKGNIAPPDVRCSRKDLDRTAETAFDLGDGDFTLHQTIIMQLVRHLLEELKVKIAAWTDQDAAMREMLKHDAAFNQRQRSIIARALRKPDATFTVKYHQTNHAIAYSTARRDLLELEERGYLSMGYESRAMVFRPGDELRRLSR